MVTYITVIFWTNIAAFLCKEWWFALVLQHSAMVLYFEHSSHRTFGCWLISICILCNVCAMCTKYWCATHFQPSCPEWLPIPHLTPVSSSAQPSNIVLPLGLQKGENKTKVICANSKFIRYDRERMDPFMNQGDQLDQGGQVDVENF